MSGNPFEKCETCLHEGKPQHVMPCLSCTFGSNYTNRHTLPNGKQIYISTASPRSGKMYELMRKIINDMGYNSTTVMGGDIMPDKFEIKRAIFNDPYTIILWKDGTKTMVKTQGDDPYDPEKGFAIAVCKKVYGNTGSYYDEFKKWIK